ATILRAQANPLTVIAVDRARLVGTAQEKADLQTALLTFAALPAVNAQVVDVGTDARVAFANEQADGALGCSYAKNLVATELDRIIDGARTASTQYVLLVDPAADNPFFRYPDSSPSATDT